MKKTLLYVILIFCLAQLFNSCTRDPSIKEIPLDDGVFNPVTFMRENYPDLHFLNLGGDKFQTRSGDDESGMVNHYGNMEPNWEYVTYHEREDALYIQVPFKNKYTIWASRELKVENEISRDFSVIHTILVIRVEEGATPYPFITTLFPSNEYLQNTELEIWNHSFDVDGTSFSGYVIQSFLNGTMNFGKIYHNGEIINYLYPPLLDKTEELNYCENEQCQGEEFECIDSCECPVEESAVLQNTRSSFGSDKDFEDIDDVIGTLYINFVDISAGTPAYVFSNEWGDWGSTCAACGMPGCNPSQCQNPIVVRPNPPCSRCGSYYCAGGCYTTRCPYCGYISCQCRPIGGGGSGSGGGGGNGSGPGTGSGSDEDDNSNPGPGQDEDNKPKIDPNEILSGLDKWDEKTRKQIEQLLNKIETTCMGQALLSAISNSIWEAELILDLNGKKSGSFLPTNLSITLHGLYDYVLFHELFHYYQFIVGNGLWLQRWAQTGLNHEAEAWIAEYLYIQKNYAPGDPVFDRYLNIAFYSQIAYIASMLDSSGNLLPDESEEEFMKNFNNLAINIGGLPSYGNLTRDPNWSMDYMKENINRILKNC